MHEPMDDGVSITLLVVVIIVFVVAITIAVMAYRKAVKRGYSVPFGRIPGLHLVLAVLVPWVELVLGLVEFWDPRGKASRSSDSDEE